MKKLVQFITKKVKEIKINVWWYFNEDRVQLEYEEELHQKYLAEQKSLEESYAKQEEEEALRWKELDEIRREQEGNRLYEQEKAMWARIEEEDKHLTIYCSSCGQLDCTCYDTIENFSEHPSLSVEDDAEPMSPEIEYWNTRCDKCGKFPEFCPCDGKFED